VGSLRRRRSDCRVLLGEGAGDQGDHENQQSDEL